MSIAALPMYDLPELREATDALWCSIVARLADLGVDAPASLMRGPPLDDIWTDPGLLLAQTCGYPLVTTLAGKVALVATPRYSAPGCDGADYRSAMVVRADDPAARLEDLRGRRCAINDVASNSGMNLLRAAVAPLAGVSGSFFREVIITGGHAASVQAIGDGRADIAAIDCVTWAHLQRWRPSETNALRVLDWTGSSPGLPLITSRRTDSAIRRALLQALDDVAQDEALAPVRAALLLVGFVTLPFGAYDAVSAIEQRAQAAGYPTLC